MSQYDQQAIIDAFREVMPQIRNSNDPEGSLLKYASDKNLPPAVLERLAQVHNTAKTLNVMSKAAQQEDRGQSFSIIDTPELLARYTTWEPPAKSAFPYDDNALGWLERDSFSLSKAAGEKVVVEDQVPDLLGQVRGHDRYDYTEKAAAAPESVARVKPASEVKREIQFLADIASEMDFHVGSIYERQKSAAILNPNFCGEVYQDARLEHAPADVLQVLTKFAAWLNHHGIRQEPFTSFEKDERIIATDRHKAAGWVEELVGHTTTILGATGMALEMAKEASNVTDEEVSHLGGMHDVYSGETGGFEENISGATPTSRVMDLEPPGPGNASSLDEVEETSSGPSGTSGGGGSKKKEEGKASSPKGKPERKLTADPKGRGRIDLSALPNAAGDYTGGLIASRADALHRQQLVQDKATADLNAITVLQRLMLTDEVLSEANPEEVVSQFNTIRRANPELAQDPNLLKIALREAVGYGGMPLHSYDQLLDIRNKSQKSTGGDSKSPNLNINLLGI